MNRKEYILKCVAETLLEEERLFFVTVDAEGLRLPLKGMQRLVMGGNATPKLHVSEAGIDASLSINRTHYDVTIPWKAVMALEGGSMAIYCGGEDGAVDPSGEETPEKKEKKGRANLKVVK